MADEESRASRWYVMLFPETRGPDTTLREMAALTGGEPTPDPHVTIGYYRSAAPARDLLDRLRDLDGLPAVVRAADPFSFLEGAHPLFGYTLSLHVERTAGLRRWHNAVLEALRPVTLPPWPSGENPGYHLQAVRQMAVPPREALERLRGREWRVQFTATTLIATQRVGDTFERRLERRLGDAM